MRTVYSDPQLHFVSCHWPLGTGLAEVAVGMGRFIRPESDLRDRTSESHKPMSELKISEEEIYSKLYNLKTDKSPGLDMIHPRVLFEMRDVINTLYFSYTIKV